MKVKHFEELIAWQKAQDLAVEIYSNFKENKDWDFRNQICRASVSISNNIAEGFDRSSNLDFRRFLFIALASCSEVRSMLHLSKRLGYLNDDKTKALLQDSTEVSMIIWGLQTSLNKEFKKN